MEKYKNDNEAAKKYADLAVTNPNNGDLELQHQAACLDFAAGANWKEEQLRLSFVSQQRELLLAFAEWMEYNSNHKTHKQCVKEFLKANNCG